ncbi:MAG: 2,4-dihydroxyhept-2-ene-1,7-dioic acid aldolase [Pelagibacterium sp. SCN 63-23]|nr:MAG: 2,4-dihydroxyhept-2-ene-1,7-dioic acid aldolase [Pelagibacterium sp. SCN 63-23]
MPLAINSFKKALAEQRLQLGLWLGLANETSAELCAGAGFDWLLVDGEHAPFDIPTIAAQLRALQASPSHAVVRPPIGEAWIIKQLLDIGAQTLLVPMVDTAEQAKDLVRATRYPPHGIRGVGAALARASGYNRTSDYLKTANDEICLLVQVETVKGLNNIVEIAAIEGVDGIFIGPSDLAADMGHLGNPGHPDVQQAVRSGLERIIASGRAAGILTADEKLARSYIALGATFVAVGTDVTLLSRATSDLATRFKSDLQHSAAAQGY